MNISTTQSITVDLRNNNPIPLVNFIQQDNNILNITVLDNGANADLSTVNPIYVNIKRPDGIVYTHSLTWSGNVVTYPLSGDDMAVAGICQAELKFYSADYQNQKISTKQFKINLFAEVGAVTVTGTTPEYTLLEQLIDQMKDVPIDGGNFVDTYTGMTDKIDGGTF